jgi:hypothetical protein
MPTRLRRSLGAPAGRPQPLGQPILQNREENRHVAEPVPVFHGRPFTAPPPAGGNTPSADNSRNLLDTVDANGNHRSLREVRGVRIPLRGRS